MIDLLHAMLFALALTILIEVAVAVALGCRSSSDVSCVIVANLVTHPPFASLYLIGGMWLKDRWLIAWWLLLLECAVIAVEWRMLRTRLSRAAPPAWLLALLMNLISVTIGWFVPGGVR